MLKIRNCSNLSLKVVENGPKASKWKQNTLKLPRKLPKEDFKMEQKYIQIVLNSNKDPYSPKTNFPRILINFFDLSCCNNFLPGKNLKTRIDFLYWLHYTVI